MPELRPASSMALHGLGLLGLLGLLGCESRPILLYHSVGEAVDAPRWVRDEAFAAQLDWLVEEGYTPITASELDRIELDGAPGPARPILLTFDDGYQNFYEHAFPALAARGLRATMFLISGRVGADPGTRFRDERAAYLVQSEVREMEAAGIEFQSHSVSHRNLKTLSDPEALAELTASREALLGFLHHPVTVFAYPFGGNEPHTHELVRAAGYRSAHSVSAGLDGAYARLRGSVHLETSVADFARLVGGTWWGEASGAR